jgi:DNA replicative helicase MCM subunit Mcm2 (Cdc46/Mcm family)
MSKKVIVCESCEAEFKIQHEMDDHFYSVKHCPFCGDTLSSDNEDVLYEEDDEWE